MHILITTFSFPSLELNHYDGKFVLAEAKAYANCGAQVTVLTPHYKNAKRVDTTYQGITIIRFSYFWPKRFQSLKKPGMAIYSNKSIFALLQIPFLLVSFSYYILKLARSADIIHAQWTVTGFLALPAKILFRTPLVVTARGSDLRLLPNFLNSWLFRSISAHINCWAPIPSMNTIRDNASIKSIVLPLIVDYEPATNVPEDLDEIVTDKHTVTIMYVGRLVRLKIDQGSLLIDLIKAIKNIDSSLAYHICIIGDGEADTIKTLHELITAESVANRISFLGSKTNISDYITFADIGLGGQGLNAVCQEYIVANVPQILPLNDPDTSSLWTHGTNAFLCNQGNYCELSTLLTLLITDVSLRKNLADNARRNPGQHVATIIDGGKQYLTAFQKIIK